MHMEQDRFFLELALEEAEKALQENTYPVGAIIVDEDFNVVGKGRNRVHSSQDITAHAEIDAMRNAGHAIFDAKINNKKFTIYSTLEPCPMCTGGILFAKIQRVVWLLNDEPGFGGYKKIKGSSVFEEKFNRIEMVEEPLEDLKMRQLDLMANWATNPNNVISLRQKIRLH
ncbi:nucleoside deaminase [Psychrobacillus sp. OK028]|uniref:nucleoside deaminase n=1 Tax=Psychrobacillus sp. OK028 TaxID=1884359 RepID=UPI0011137D1F|nr:nucleoside deaminase [Psychrobacillus sp. OK028]